MKFYLLQRYTDNSSHMENTYLHHQYLLRRLYDIHMLLFLSTGDVIKVMIITHNHYSTNKKLTYH